MKLLTIIMLSNMIIFNLTAQTGYKLDQTDPTNVVNAVFYSARTGNYEILENLCDPEFKGDGDTKRICALTNMQEQSKMYGMTEDMKKQFNEFNEYFKLASIYGKVAFETNDSGEEIAKVPFMFNHPGGDARSSETMKLIKRENKWYLYSF